MMKPTPEGIVQPRNLLSAGGAQIRLLLLLPLLAAWIAACATQTDYAALDEELPWPPPSAYATYDSQAPLKITAMDVAKLPPVPPAFEEREKPAAVSVASAAVAPAAAPAITPQPPAQKAKPQLAPEPDAVMTPIASTGELHATIKPVSAPGREFKVRLREQIEQQKTSIRPPQHNPYPDAAMLESHTPPKLLLDDLDKDSLIQALENQIKIMDASDKQEPFRLNGVWLHPQKLKETLAEFLALVQQSLPPEEFSRRVHQEFAFYEAGKGKSKKVTFTGYYTPVIKASRFQTAGYSYPLYYLPEQFQSVALAGGTYPAASDGDYSAPQYLVRNLTREDIDGRQALANRNLEIAWLQDDIERFFLHIQGSGVLTYVNGATESVQFLGSNGYPYESIGKMMIQDGVITLGEGSMQGIKRYFVRHPQDIPKYLYKNRRYIFFKLSSELPRGSSGSEVTAHRSIATDKKFYPHGGLGFIIAKKPVLNEKNEIVRWESFARFVVDQDTGNAIRGPGRADLYFGIGDEAGAAAGHYKQDGKLFYLVKK